MELESYLTCIGKGMQNNETLFIDGLHAILIHVKVIIYVVCGVVCRIVFGDFSPIFAVYSCFCRLMKEIRPKSSTQEIHKRFRKLKELSNKDKSNSNTTTDDFWAFSLYEFFYLPNVLQVNSLKLNMHLQKRKASAN